MRNRVIAAIAGAAAVAGAAYVARWRWNYTHRTRELDLEVPDDVAGPVDLTSEEVEILDDLEDKTCMNPCCVDYDEISAYYPDE